MWIGTKSRHMQLKTKRFDLHQKTRKFATCPLLPDPRTRSNTCSTVRFKLIPEGPCAKAGARYEGAPPVHGPHANSRWLCDNHQQAAKRSASKSEAVIVDIIPPSALPADRFCTVCARLLVNQRGGSEYEQVADVCCEVICAPHFFMFMFIVNKNSL